MGNYQTSDTCLLTSTEIPIFVEKDFMIRATLIAENQQLRDSVAGMLHSCCPNITLAVSTDSVKKGVAAVNEHEPDLLLIDTRLADGSGFDLIRHFDKPDFKVIFISNSIDYAVTAIKFGAVDYLLKPIDEEELALAVNKASDIIRFEESLHQKAMGESLKDLSKSHRMVLKTSDQVHAVNISDIIRIEADSNYSSFYMADGRRIVVSKGIKEFEEQLLEHGFHRIHKSHIFNINQMHHFDKADGGFVVMADGSKVPVASRKRDMLLQLFEGI
jgi:two-component system LytT family response regulator